jgi:hypothetical protein
VSGGLAAALATIAAPVLAASEVVTASGQPRPGWGWNVLGLIAMLGVVAVYTLWAIWISRDREPPAELAEEGAELAAPTDRPRPGQRG